MPVKLDALAGIAARGSKGAARPAPASPVVLPDLRLPPMQPGEGAAFPVPPTPTAEALREELEELRKKMQPFMAELAPHPDACRRVQILDSAEWRLEPDSDWQSVRVPHYGGPMGRARAWYRMDVFLEQADFAAGTIWLCFGGVDYRAAVFFNGQLTGTHEGFFSPFEFDVTPFAKQGRNELLVRVDNDAICHGNKTWDKHREGDKIYGATGLGWDEPGVGWHHCPPGMGIHRPVKVESRPAIFIYDGFVRSFPEECCVEAWLEVFNSREEAAPFVIETRIHGRNFQASDEAREWDGLPQAGPGLNRYVLRIPIRKFRQWSPAEPWLYRLNLSLQSSRGRDTSTVSFGMRSFVLDESPGPDGFRGRFLLNGRPVRLRGANTMGHEQQCVFRGELDQLRDDILIAKLCHLNFLRFTQRPVDPEVYDMCDRLGMMAQTDLPLFGYLRRNQFAEAVRQAGEMARLIRRYPSNILASFINEPFPASWGDQTHRQLSRAELESFFTAAAAAIRVENPDQQIKPIDGDYDPPGPGLPDSHCYAGWYNGHGLDLGRLHKGYWMGVKQGWNYACGEFGSEGLENEDLMRERYPRAWLPVPGEEKAWTPERIAKCQTATHHALWFEAGTSLEEWIRRSQEHQAWITRLMTEAFRRNNRMVSFAIHLLIDAWPAGWMKSIMDCRRHPKPAFFAYRSALSPLAAFLRMDRTAFFAGESIEADVWVCVDGDLPSCPLRLAYQIESDGRVLQSGRTAVVAKADEAVFQGRLGVNAPLVSERTTLELRIALIDHEDRVVHSSEQRVKIHPLSPLRIDGEAVFIGGGSGSDIARMLPADWLVASDPREWESARDAVEAGATILFSGCPPGEFEIAGSRLRFESCGMEPRHFVARSLDHPVAQQFDEDDFRFWFDRAQDCPSPLLHTLFFADETWMPILRTSQGGWGAAWTPALAAAERRFGQGRVIVCQLVLSGRFDNPVAQLLLAHLAGIDGVQATPTESKPHYSSGQAVSSSGNPAIEPVKCSCP